MNLGEKARSQLVELQKQPENKICMDCGARDPRWVSLNLGTFICIKCAGAHRSLGSHISTPKSIDQDNWTLDQVEHIRKKGNANAKKYFEATLKPSDTWENGTKKVISETIALESFVRRKYEYLEFAPKKETGLSGSGGNSRQRAATTSPSSLPGFVLPSYESTRKSSRDDSGLINFDPRTNDYLSNDVRSRGEPVTKSDIMQLYDAPKLQPTPAPVPKPIAPPTPTYPTANYNVNLHAPNYNMGHGNPYGYGMNGPVYPYGNPHLPPPYASAPAYAGAPSYGAPLTSSQGAVPLTSSLGAQRPMGPDKTPTLPPRLPSISSTLPPLSASIPLSASYGSPAPTAYGGQLTSSYGVPSLTSSYGAPPAQAPNPFPHYGAPQSPAYQMPRPNYGTPMPPNYGQQPANPFTNEMDPNFLASQFNMR